jgi:hypothetical protein
MLEYRISSQNETDVQVISLSFIKNEFFEKVINYEEGKFLSINNFNEKKIDEIKISNPEKIRKDQLVILKSICEIRTMLYDGIRSGSGSGFFIKLLKGDNPLYCLMTTEHLIGDEAIKSKEKIVIGLGEIKKIITLNKEERFIQSFPLLDITIIEILKERDDIPESYFLQPYLDNPNDLKDKNIFVQIFAGFSSNFTLTEVREINKYKFKFCKDSDVLYSGSPIFYEDSEKVMGIAVGSSIKYNYGNMILPIINWINGNEIYDKDQYEGDYVNDKFEGKGRYTYITGNYYIGEFKNGKRNGKGEYYEKNGDLLYKGNWVDDKFCS